MIRECSEDLPRYEIRPEATGRWTVVDMLTLLPAATDGRDFIGLAKEDARDIADELNRSFAEGRDPLI
jgi:phage gpG-like protein